MDRRKALKTTTLAIAVWPQWILRAFGAENCRVSATGGRSASRIDRDHDPHVILFAAYQRARRLAKPLVLLVVPETEAYNRAHAFGEAINHGSDETLATMAMAEFVATPMNALKTLLPQHGIHGEPLMVIIETDRIPAQTLVLDEPIVGTDELFSFDSDASDAAVDARIGVVSRLLHTGLAGTQSMVRQRMAHQIRVFGQGPVASVVTGITTGAKPDLQQVDQFAVALFAEAQNATGPMREHLIGLLSMAARRRLRDGRVAGSRWARSDGCGEEVEWNEKEIEEGLDRESLGIACGMGHVPRKSVRFLDFLSRGSEQR